MTIRTIGQEYINVAGITTRQVQQEITNSTIKYALHPKAVFGDTEGLLELEDRNNQAAHYKAGTLVEILIDGKHAPNEGMLREGEELECNGIQGKGFTEGGIIASWKPKSSDFSLPAEWTPEL